MLPLYNTEPLLSVVRARIKNYVKKLCSEWHTIHDISVEYAVSHNAMHSRISLTILSYMSYYCYRQIFVFYDKLAKIIAFLFL